MPRPADVACRLCALALAAVAGSGCSSESAAAKADAGTAGDRDAGFGGSAAIFGWDASATADADADTGPARADAGASAVTPPDRRCGVEQVIERADLLFVIDNSGSMSEEQAALQREFPKLVHVLTTGDTDGDGTQEFPPATDLHLGVVSSDMGLPGISGVQKCDGLGDDGLLLHAPSAAVEDCAPSYPTFLSYTADRDADRFASDFACIAALGTEGCGFEQQLEAGLKALWPSVDVDPQTGQVIEPNRIRFVSDANGEGMLGHGDRENRGFLRADSAQNASLLAIIVVTDEEDCSSADTRHFAPNDFLPADDPLREQPLNLRCFYNPDNLYPVQRYVAGFRALRPSNDALVMFAAIAGVPPELVDAEARAAVDFTDPGAREAFYDDLLAHPAMQEVVDPATPMLPDNGRLTASCDTETGKAYPPRRIVEVARQFGENGVVQSICAADFGPAIDAILGRIGDRLRNPCLNSPD